MAGITLAQAQAALDEAMTQYLAALKVASYSIKDRSQTKQNIADLKKQVDEWDMRVKMLTRLASRRGRTRYVVNA